MVEGATLRIAVVEKNLMIFFAACAYIDDLLPPFFTLQTHF